MEIFIILGSTDGRIHVWRTTDGEKLTTLSTDNSSDCIQCVQFNPKSFMLASASTNMVRSEHCSYKRNYFLLSFFFRYFGCRQSMMTETNLLIIRCSFFCFSCSRVQYSYYIVMEC